MPTLASGTHGGAFGLELLQLLLYLNCSRTSWALAEASNVPRTKTVAIINAQVRVYGDTAVVTGKADVKGTLGGQDATGQVLFHTRLCEKNQRWQSVSFQQTRVSNP